MKKKLNVYVNNMKEELLKIYEEYKNAVEGDYHHVTQHEYKLNSLRHFMDYLDCGLINWE